MFLFLRLHPLRIFELFIWLFAGKAYFKRRLADAVLPEVGDIPYHRAVLTWLEQQRDGGARLVLATASDKRIANAVAEYLGIFDEVLGTEDKNLSSEQKRVVLVERFGEKRFEYVGNSSADLLVWRSAAAIIGRAHV